MARRYRAALAAAKAGQVPPAPRGPPARIARFPWEELRDEITPQSFVLAGFFVRLVVEAARDEIGVQQAKIVEETGGLLGPPTEDVTAQSTALTR